VDEWEGVSMSEKECVSEWVSEREGVWERERERVSEFVSDELSTRVRGVVQCYAT
jgi:hypothetical protein